MLKNKITSLEEYAELAQRTLVDLGSEEANTFHMEAGVLTEFGEFINPLKAHIAYGKPLDYANLKEELGDMCWFIVNSARLSNSLDFTNMVETFEKLREQKVNDFDMLDFSRFALILGQVELNRVNQISRLLVVYAFSLRLGFDFYDVLTTNINKLMARFPDKFDADKAINRDLEKERKILES